jgi:hypothetical protein
MQWSLDARVMIDPAGEYRRLRDAPGAGWRRALARPLLVALALGAGTSVMCTGLLTPALLVSGAACWFFVPLIQTVTASLALRAPEGSPARAARRVELLFLGHVPWTFWLIGLATLSLMMPPLDLVVVGLSALLPLALTARILYAFCREVLLQPAAAALHRVLLHQALTWAIVLVYVQFASQLVPRFVGSVQP